MIKLKRIILGTLCLYCIGSSLYFYNTIKKNNQDIEEKNAKIETLCLENQEVGKELEAILEEMKVISTQNEDLRLELDSARQEEYELTTEIKRLEGIKEQIRVSRGAISSFEFTSNSDITTIRIENGDLLDEGLRGNLKGLGWTFVNAGIEYGIDPLFLAAISAQESGWGLASSNLFGAINYSGESYETQIYRMAKDISENYISALNMNTPSKIQPRYCPSPNDWHYKVSACANTIIKNIGA